MNPPRPRNDKIRESLVVMWGQRRLQEYAAKDMRLVADCLIDVPQPSLQQMEFLMRDPGFQHFLGSTSCEMLILQGSFNNFAASRISPMTNVAFTLINTLSDSTPVAHFFCGMHLDVDDSMQLGTPVGILKSMIVQLLAMNLDIDADLGYTSDRQTILSLRNGDFEALSYLFKVLMRNITSGVVLFVIEGLNLFCEYETEFMFVDLIARLHSIISDDLGIRATLKILICATGGRSLPDEEGIKSVYMPADRGRSRSKGRRHARKGAESFDHVYGPNGIVKYLLTQLLALKEDDLDLGSSINDTPQKSLARWNFGAICSFLQRLLRRIYAPIQVVIDGLKLQRS